MSLPRFVEGDKNALVPYDHAIRHIARRHNLPVFGMARGIVQHRGRRSTGLATFDHISQRYDGPPCGDGEGGEDDGGGRGGGTTTDEKKGRSSKTEKEQGKEAVMAEETKKGERKKEKETNMNTNTIANVGEPGKNPLPSPVEPLLHAPDFGTCTFLDLLRFRAAVEQLPRPNKCGLLLKALAKRGSHITLDDFCACVSPAPKRGGGGAWAGRGEGGLSRRTMGDIGMCYLEGFAGGMSTRIYGSEEMLSDRARKCKYTRGSEEVLTIAIERF